MMDKETELRSLVFEQLKKVCDKLITNLNQENVRKVIEVVNAVPSNVFWHFVDYILFPIQLHLLKYSAAASNIETNALLELIQCLRIVIEKSVVESLDKFVNLNGLLLGLIMDIGKLELNGNSSEDLKYEVISCVHCLYKSLDRNEELLKNLYNCERKLNIHSQAVYACTQIAKAERMTKLRTEAMKCLLAIMLVHEKEYLVRIPTDRKWHVAEIVASMFPGIISSCYVILMSNSILHRDIYIVCIQIFCRSLALIFSDDENKFGNTDELESRFKYLVLKSKNNGECGRNRLNIKTIRSDIWLASAKEKLATVVHCLVPLVNNQQLNIRQELVSEIGVVLKNCRHVESVQRPLLHVLVILSLDHAELVSKGALDTLKFLLDQPYPRGSKILQDLEESFFQSLDSVHSAINSAHEDVLISQLNLLSGLLQILNLEHMFKSSIYLDRLINVLISLVRFDAATVSTFNEQKIQDLSDSLDDDLISYVSWRNSKYLSSQTEKIVKNIFVAISRKVNLESMSYHLLEILESDAADRKEVLYLVNNIILCGQLRSYKKRIRVVRNIFEVYLNPEYWMLLIHETDKNKSLSLALIRNNLLQVCLLIEGIGNMAYCLQHDFKPLLIHCLYLIIERAGCANKFLSIIGLTALQKISTACDYSDIIELMSDNVDFITHRATVMLRHLQPNTNVFDVFCVIIAYSRKNSLAVLCDVVQSLLESDDIVHDVYSAGFLRVFAMFIRRLRCWFVSTVDDECTLNESDDKLSEMLTNLCTFYAGRQQRSQVYQWNMCAAKDELVDLEEIFREKEYDFGDILNDNDSKQDDEVPEPPPVAHEIEEQEKKVPEHIKLVISIAEKIVHVLPHRNTSNKILIIEILIDTLLILFDSGEDELLPIIHKVWSPLVNRFEYDKSEALLMRRCFELLCVMATTAKDFIKSRTLKSVQPAINEFLLDAAKDSRLKDKKSVYRMSQRYKLQLTLLRQLGFLAVHLNFQENEIQGVLVASTSYLSCKQPIPLQEACVNLFTTIEAEYRDFVKIYLLSLCVSRSTFTSPNVSEFHSINVKGTNDSAAIEYQRNVFRLLEHKLPDCWFLLDGE